jgi:hypothetical protein
MFDLVFCPFKATKDAFQNNYSDMSQVLKIKLKPSVMSRLEQRTKELKTNADSLINKALEDYFYFERLNGLRKELKSQAQKQGIENEEGLFDAVS